MRTFEEIKNTIETGLGVHKCDLKIANVKLVNVFSGQVYDTDIYIKNKRVVSIDPEAGLEAEKTIDGCGQYAVPGLKMCIRDRIAGELCISQVQVSRLEKRILKEIRMKYEK